MKNDRRLWLKALAALPFAGVLPALADEGMEAIRKRGSLRVAVYNDFPPYATAGGKGIDADIARAIAGKLGLTAQVVGYNAGEDMNDDLRNMVWKGHYLRGEPADVMLRVPVDPEFAKDNEQARIFGAYQQEVMGMARVASRIPAPSGSAAVALEVFTREKIGVEGDTLADSFLGGVLQGRLRSNITHFRSIGEAVKALQEDSVAAVMAPLAELEGALVGETRFAVEEAKLGELNPKRWAVGMAVKADSDELATALSGALSELQKDGTVAAIFKRHGVTPRTN